MPSEFAKVRVACSLDHYIDYWCDSNDYSWLTFGKSGVCHFTLARGTWELNISGAFVPTLHGLAMLYLFSYALRHAVARESTSEASTPVEQQVRSPIENMGVRDSRVSNEVAQDLKKLLEDTMSDSETSAHKVAVPIPDSESNSLEGYVESLAQNDMDIVPRRLGPRPRKA